MSKRLTMEELIVVIGDDAALIEEMREEELLVGGPEGYDEDQVERVMVTRTLVRELGVNWPGVEIILRMRDELMTHRRELASMAQLLRRQESDGDSGSNE